MVRKPRTGNWPVAASTLPVSQALRVGLGAPTLRFGRGALAFRLGLGLALRLCLGALVMRY